MSAAVTLQDLRTKLSQKPKRTLSKVEIAGLALYLVSKEGSVQRSDIQTYAQEVLRYQASKSLVMVVLEELRASALLELENLNQNQLGRNTSIYISHPHNFKIPSEVGKLWQTYQDQNFTDATRSK